MDLKKLSEIFSEGISDFGDSMKSIQNEIRKDAERSDNNQRQRASINKEHLDKIWGKKND